MGSNIAMDERLDIHARGFLEPQRAAFFEVRVFHPNADCYRDKELDQIYRNHENEERRLYSRRTLDIEQGTFTSFSSTGGMGKECLRFHSRLAELLAEKKGESYSTTISWKRARTSFALLRSALVCLRGSRSRNFKSVIGNIDLDICSKLFLDKMLSRNWVYIYMHLIFILFTILYNFYKVFLRSCIYV